MKKVVLFITIILIIFVVAGLYNKIKIQEYNIYSEKVTNNLKIVVITDLHSCKYGDNQVEIIENIKKQSPDVILLVGDIADDLIPHDNTIELLKGIQNITTYYVSGNHEYWSGEIDNIKDMFKKYNVVVLEGRNDILKIGDNEINISGIDDYEIGETEYVNQLNSASENINKSNYSILIAHRPERIELYKKYNYDLVVSGHAHGGQWRIPFILNGLLAPDQGLFPKYAGGMYTHENLIHIVSRGLAKESTKIFRFYNRPELVVINVLTKK